MLIVWLYRGEINSLQIHLSRTQAGPGRAFKEHQEQNSPNHVQRINLISVESFISSVYHYVHYAQLVTWYQEKEDIMPQSQATSCTLIDCCWSIKAFGNFWQPRRKNLGCCLLLKRSCFCYYRYSIAPSKSLYCTCSTGLLPPWRSLSHPLVCYGLVLWWSIGSAVHWSLPSNERSDQKFAFNSPLTGMGECVSNNFTISQIFSR